MPKTSKKFLIDVVPLTRIPLSKNQSFSYLHSEKLPTGTLVSIPLFRRKVEGIVIGSKDDFERLGNIELKNVASVIQEELLDKKQFELARYISKYYFSPLGTVLKPFVPKIVKERKKNSPADPKKSDPEIVLTEEQEAAVKKIIGQKTGGKGFLLFGPSGSGKTEVYIHSMKRLWKKLPSSQFLILLPELTLTPQAIERYGEYFPKDETVVLNSHISKGKFYSALEKIRSGEARLIIGTRMAVFAPFRNLKLITIDEEQDMSHKQWDMNPRYDARTLAEELGRIHKSRIVMGSSTPRVETFWRAQEKDLTLLALPPLKLPGIKDGRRDFEIVDMRKERWKDRSGKVINSSPISKRLQGEIAYALRNSQKIVLFINRQGMSNFSVCEACKEVLRCPRCDRALVYGSGGNYHCLHCSFQTDILPKCPKCGKLSFKNIGLGTQKIEKEVQELFPGASTVRADNQTTKKAGSAEKIYQEFKEGKTDILIGTQMISKGWDLRNLSLVAIIDTDNLLSSPDLYTDERAFQNILQAGGRAGRVGADFPGKVIIQTFHPDNPLIRQVAENDYRSFFLNQIKDRESLKLPPFGRLIKLIYQNQDLEKTGREGERIASLLDDIQGEKFSSSPPHPPLVPKIRGKNRIQIIIKLQERPGKRLSDVLEKLPSGWIIDVDPISIA